MSARMRDRADIIAALRFARNRHAAELANAAGHRSGTPDHAFALSTARVHEGQIDAFRFMLRLKPHEPDPME